MRREKNSDEGKIEVKYGPLTSVPAISTGKIVLNNGIEELSHEMRTLKLLF